MFDAMYENRYVWSPVKAGKESSPGHMSISVMKKIYN